MATGTHVSLVHINYYIGDYSQLISITNYVQIPCCITYNFKIYCILT